MCEGVDAKRCMIDKYGAPEETNYESCPTLNRGSIDRRSGLLAKAQIDPATSTQDSTQNPTL
jgi:hypothetical protein